MFSDIIDVFIDLVGNDYDLWILCQHSSQTSQFFFAVNRTGRVRRWAKYQCFGFGSNGSFQLRRSNFEILFDTGSHNHRCTFCQFHHFRIAYPIRSRYNDLVTRIHQHHNSVTYRLFCPICTRNLSGCIFQTVFFLQFLYDSITQSRITRNRRVAREVVIYRFLGSFFDVVGSIEVWFSYT